MDAFYVSCELQRRPELRGQPVVVAGQRPARGGHHGQLRGRKFGVFSATPASRARRVCPEAMFVRPTSPTTAQRSREVMEVLHEQLETVEVVGPRRGIPGPHGLRAPQRRRQAGQGGGHRAHGARVLDRHRAEQARREGGLGRRQARRLPLAHRGGGARTLRRRLTQAGARHRPQDRRAAGGAGRPAAGAARPDGRSASCPSCSDRAWAPTSAAWRGSRTTASSRPSGCASRSPRRRRSTATCAASSRWSRSWRGWQSSSATTSSATAAAAARCG